MVKLAHPEDITGSLRSSDDVCKIAEERWKNAAKWLNLWSTLLFIFGSTIVIFLVISILFLMREDWLPGVLTTLGTIVEGIGIKWVYDRRKESLEEERAAYEEMTEVCDDTSSSDTLRAKMKLF